MLFIDTATLHGNEFGHICVGMTALVYGDIIALFVGKNYVTVDLLNNEWQIQTVAIITIKIWQFCICMKIPSDSLSSLQKLL